MVKVKQIITDLCPLSMHYMITYCISLCLSQLQYSLCRSFCDSKQQKTNHAQVLNPHALMQMAQDLTGGKSSETLTI